eukprot:5544285-Prymnesium_polylepis.1
MMPRCVRSHPAGRAGEPRACMRPCPHIARIRMKEGLEREQRQGGSQPVDWNYGSGLSLADGRGRLSPSRRTRATIRPRAPSTGRLGGPLNGGRYRTPLCLATDDHRSIGLWLQFDVGRQHQWVFCAVSSPVGHAKIDQMSPRFGLRRRLA